MHFSVKLQTGSIVMAAPKAEGVASTTEAAITPDELLQKHYPRYHYDKTEKHFPVDLNA